MFSIVWKYFDWLLGSIVGILENWKRIFDDVVDLHSDGRF